jgi:hypothetical protein
MPVQLYEPGWRAALMTAAYYHVLNSDPDFGAELAALYQTLGEIGDREPTAGDVEQMKWFADHWKLPPAYAVADIWSSAVDRWEPFAEVARPKRGSPPPEPPSISLDMELGKAIWLDAVRARLSVNREARGLDLHGGGWSNLVLPKLTLDHDYYHPAVVPRWLLKQWANQAAARLRQNILDQADEIDRQAKAAGMSVLHPRLHNREHLMLIARRLYLRAVKRKSWGAIAGKAGPGRGPAGKPRRGGEVSARKAVIGSVKRWARQLGVPLPPDPRGLE